MSDNWKRNQIISEAARRIVSQAPDISKVTYSPGNMPGASDARI